jgi:hypothetical protein
MKIFIVKSSIPKIFSLMVVILSIWASSAGPGFFLSQSAGFSENPLGLLIETDALCRIPLSNSKGILWKTTKIDIGLHNGWTPADDVLGVRIAIEPIAPFDVTLCAGYYGMFDALGYGYYAMQSPSSPYDDKTRKGLEPSSVNGWWSSAAPRLKLKIGHALALDCVTADYFSLQSTGYFLEVRSYTIHKTRDLDVQNDAYALYEASGAVMAGVNYHTIWVRGTGVFSDRLSALVIVRPAVRPAVKGFESPFVAVLAGLYFRDPLYRMNAYVAAQAGFELKLE